MPTATKLEPLTARQREVYEYVWEYTCREGFQPSFEELCAHFGIHSRNGIKTHVDSLARKGWVRTTKNGTRSLRFLRTPDGRPFRGFRAIEEDAC